MIVHQVSSSGFGVEEVAPERMRAFIDALEGEVAKMDPVEVPVDHEFADGVYSRKILIPKDAVLTGRVHKQNDLNIVIYGEMDVLTESGMKRIIGPAVFPGKAGVKQFGIAYADTLWVTVHHTHLTDLEEIDKELFEDGPGIYDFVTGKLKQETLPCQA